VPLPDFLIAGASKAGTTALHAALTRHPQLFLPALTEPKFFLSDGPPPRTGGPGDAQTYQEHVWRREAYEELFVPAPRGYANVVARSADGVSFATVATITKERFGAESLERPAIVRTPAGRWRLYVSAATPGTKHWRVDLLEADDLAGLTGAPARTVLAGSAALGVKDPVLLCAGGRWHLWASCHPLESWDEADRMSTWYATSPTASTGPGTAPCSVAGGAGGTRGACGCRACCPPVTACWPATTGARRRRRTGRSAPEWPAAPCYRTARTARCGPRRGRRSARRTRRTGCGT
jgi:hypothetical protein